MYESAVLTKIYQIKFQIIFFSTNINISNKKLVSLVAKGSLSDNQFIIFYLMIGVGEDTVDHVE